MHYIFTSAGAVILGSILMTSARVLTYSNKNLRQKIQLQLITMCSI